MRKNQKQKVLREFIKQHVDMFFEQNKDAINSCYADLAAYGTIKPWQIVWDESAQLPRLIYPAESGDT
jgi:hypothetical protein